MGRPRVKKYPNHGSSERMAAADLDGRASTDGSTEYPQVRHRIAFLQVVRGSDVPATPERKSTAGNNKIWEMLFWNMIGSFANCVDL